MDPDPQADLATSLRHVCLPITPEQDAAMRFLTSKGERFLIDFGIHNCVSHANQYPEWQRPSVQQAEGMATSAVAQALAGGVTLDIVRKELARQKLREYLRLVVWPTVEPMTPFVGGYHIDAMCEHLQAIIQGQIRDLLINIAPRHTKSLCASVAMPTWAWVDRAPVRFLFASFSADLSTEHAVLSRRVIESPIYQGWWSEKFQLATDQNIKTHYENTHRGYRISTSIGGTTLGRGGDILVLDDPNNLQTIASEPERLDVKRFYTNVWVSRMNDPKTGARVIVQQRGHEGDLSGYIRSQGGYVELILPTEFDRRSAVMVPNTIGWQDPRTQDGELLNPGRFGPEEIAKAKLDLGIADFTTQHQQEPMPYEGVLFKRDKLRVVTWEELLREPYIETRGWDQASTEVLPGNDPDWTVGAKLRRYASGLYVIMHVVRGRYGPDEGDQVLLHTTVSDGKACHVIEEQEGGSSGKKVIAAHDRLLEAYIYAGVSKHVNKAVYAKPFANRVDAGYVWLLQGEWNQAFIDEVVLFPLGKKDDQVDAAATAFHELADRMIAMLKPADVLAIGMRDDEKRSAFQRKQF